MDTEAEDEGRSYRALLDQAAGIAGDPASPPAIAFARLCTLVVHARSRLLGRLLLAAHGPRVLYGPFQGMALPESTHEGCFLPKLLGCYEAELHEALNAFVAERRHRRVVNIGCGDGFYAVGLASLLPEASVEAFDIDPAARAACARLAALNGVDGRVAVAGAFDPAAFGEGADTLVVCDCEGAEYALLDPAATPGLARADIVVELHGTAADPSRAHALIGRFAATHEAAVLAGAGRNPAALPALAGLQQIDQWLAVWECRGEPTPWAVLRARRS